KSELVDGPRPEYMVVCEIYRVRLDILCLQSLLKPRCRKASRLPVLAPAELPPDSQIVIVRYPVIDPCGQYMARVRRRELLRKMCHGPDLCIARRRASAGLVAIFIPARRRQREPWIRHHRDISVDQRRVIQPLIFVRNKKERPVARVNKRQLYRPAQREPRRNCGQRRARYPAAVVVPGICVEKIITVTNIGPAS